MAETVLVTGGTGFVAGRCIVELLRRGYAVRTTLRTRAREDEVRDALSTAADPEGRLSFAVADLTSDTGWAEAVAGCEYVLHVASPLGGVATRDPRASGSSRPASSSGRPRSPKNCVRGWERPPARCPGGRCPMSPSD
ncbi:NAD-dependent epimerase/dehydratase family protein [Planotetraspora kaengkrachanensis]|uniref:NAD-dependent epimerase/dehydratase domain-containing protein n=1 Tax=Planotetraspora kaengkrachanensis TaxID=575193 RepID=A0A8J3PT52_9ACTN|nr:NAD-dependent epimerase/dehydratase family protein [Planotetraspora kaengkrachanensis]GIG80374.1 hypothetical protein Pka01_35010 [Planotetraspora kaengkrachanensis]